MSTVHPDFSEGSKKEVAELKFLIHDLRVEKFINNIIHYHVTLSTDLEIHDIEQALAFHSDDLAELKANAARLRRAFRDYSNAVTNFSPDKVVLTAGRTYLDTIVAICELILNPLWGRVDRALSFLSEESRSFRARNHYRNNIRWICGVYHRIEYFLQELDNLEVLEEFDVGHEIIDYTNNVIYGYIVEKSQSRVEIQIDRGGPAVIRANRPRFRRMYFNLVMNAVDALQDKPVGMISVAIEPDGQQVRLAVRDNGTGMYPDKISHILRERETLDGELHSLGTVFVRRTAEQLGGGLSIESEVGRGTTMLINFPYLAGVEPPPQPRSKCRQYATMPFDRESGTTVTVREDASERQVALRVSPSDAVGRSTPSQRPAASARLVAAAEEDDGDWDPSDNNSNCGRIILRDYRQSEADQPGCIFMIAVTYGLAIDTFAHKPYERLYNINHEDLSPMLYDSVVRGRLERSDNSVPELILKEPHSLHAYFDLKEIPDGRSKERFIRMIHDEYILIARKLLATGLPGEIRVHVTSAAKFLPGFEKTLGPEPFVLSALAEQPLTTETP